MATSSLNTISMNETEPPQQQSTATIDNSTDQQQHNSANQAMNTPQGSTNHQQPIVPTRKHQCSTCGKSFPRAKKLRDHEATHLSPSKRPFGCSLCEKRFANESNLKGHERTHTGEQPFKCDQCGKCFNQSAHLTTHMRTHTGEKPFACDHCDYATAISSNLREHMRAIHKLEMPRIEPYGRKKNKAVNRATTTFTGVQSLRVSNARKPAAKRSRGRKESWSEESSSQSGESEHSDYEQEQQLKAQDQENVAPFSTIATVNQSANSDYDKCRLKNLAAKNQFLNECGLKSSASAFTTINKPSSTSQTSRPAFAAPNIKSVQQCYTATEPVRQSLRVVQAKQSGTFRAPVYTQEDQLFSDTDEGENDDEDTKTTLPVPVMYDTPITTIPGPVMHAPQQQYDIGVMASIEECRAPLTPDPAPTPPEYKKALEGEENDSAAGIMWHMRRDWVSAQNMLLRGQPQEGVSYSYAAPIQQQATHGYGYQSPEQPKQMSHHEQPAEHFGSPYQPLNPEPNLAAPVTPKQPNGSYGYRAPTTSSFQAPTAANYSYVPPVYYYEAREHEDQTAAGESPKTFMDL